MACGQGRVARELTRRGGRVTGVDISAALLSKARAAEARGPLGISYVHADVTAVPAPGGLTAASPHSRSTHSRQH